MKYGIAIGHAQDFRDLNRTIQELKYERFTSEEVQARLNRTIQELKYGIAIGHAQDFRALIAPYRN